MYLWEHSLEEIRQLTTSEGLISYYNELCKEAEKTIDNCLHDHIRKK